MKKLALSLVLVFVLPAAPAWADGSSFSETQNPDDQLFHIDIGIEHATIGTIKISLPGAHARFDPVVKQSARRGRKLKLGAKVKLTVSRGPKK